MYCDPANDPNIAANWTDVFPAGTTVGWFIVSNGYSYGVDAPYGIHYSVFDLNGESLPQTIQLYDPTTEKIVLGFEDISRVYPAYSSDEDFNDCVFYITTNPITAVNRENLKRFDEDFGDKDGDGTPNKDDEYPDDPDRAFNNYYPNAVVFGTLAFEDNWPAKGDYDFNDLVVDYRVTYVTNTAGTVKDVILSSQVKAIGASYRNGFAWQLNASPGNISSVQTTYFGPGTLLGGSLFDLNAKGYENGQSKVVIPFFDNAFTLFGSSYIPNYPNTIIGANYYNPVSITKKITFTTPVNLASLGSLPYNPFMVVNQERGREVHKVGHPATDKASLSYFNTQEDITNRSTLWYVGANGAPWLIETPVQLEYPVAAAHIETTFLKFSSWAGSGGINHTDWYNNTSNGYREDSKIFRKN
jgi:LruC domain-containing protein